MSDHAATFFLAAGMGVVAGMRSMAAPALLSRRLAGRRAADAPTTRRLADPTAARVLTVLAAGEMAADKTPWVPARTEPPSLLGRTLMGALCGSVVADRRGGSLLGGALVGAAAAAGATYAAYHLRREAGARTGVPDVVWALVEDTLALAAGDRLATAAVRRRSR